MALIPQLKFDIQIDDDFIKYNFLYEFYDKLSIHINANQITKKLIYKQVFIHSSQDNFPIYQSELALLGDSIITNQLVIKCIKLKLNAKQIQDLRSKKTTNENFEIILKQLFDDLKLDINRFIIIQSGQLNRKHTSTTFEALIGSLYLENEIQIIEYLLNRIFNIKI
jgi:23S rRNA maturation mini-RNase III